MTRGAEVFRLVPPAYPSVDLAAHFNPAQLRDAHGRWVKGSGGAPSIQNYRSMTPGDKVNAAAVMYGTGSKQHEAAKVKFAPKSNGPRTLTVQESRASLKMDAGQRSTLFESAGLKTNFAEDEVSLVHRWHAAKDPSEKAALVKEMQARQKILASAIQTVKQADVVAAREDRRTRWAKWDATLAKTPVGRGLLKIRDKILSDKLADVLVKDKEKLADNGKEVALDMAATQVRFGLLAAAGALATFLLNDPEAGEAIMHIFESPLIEQARTLFENPVGESAMVVASIKGTKILAQSIASKALHTKR